MAVATSIFQNSPSTASQGGISSSKVTPAPSVVAPVVSPVAAQTHIDQVVKPAAVSADQAIQNQAAWFANYTKEKEAREAADFQARRQAEMQEEQMNIQKQAADAKMAAVMGTTGTPSKVGTTPLAPSEQVQSATPYQGGQSGTNGWQDVTYADGSRKVSTKNLDGTYTPVSSADLELQNTKDTKAREEADYIAKTAAVAKTIDDIRTGAIPLNPAEQAQVDGLKKQFEQLIEQQKLTNAGAAGIANVRGYQKGAAEYDPNFQVRTIGSIVTMGLNKVSDLMVKEASAVSELTEALKDKNISRIKSAYDIYKDTSEKRQKSLKDTIDAANTAVSDAKKAIAKVQEDKDKVAVEAAKTGAPPEVIDAIANASSVGDAITAAGDYLQGGTGIIGEYAYYRRNALSLGLVPMSFDDYQTRDANRKAAATRAGDVETPGGYTVNQEKTIATVNDAISKNETYKKTSNMRAFVDNVLVGLNSKTGVGDIAAINQFQKVIDEGAVTRDQDVKLIQSAQSLSDKLKTRLANVMSGDQLSDTLREQMKETVNNMYTAQVKALNKDPYIKTKTAELSRNGVNPQDSIIGELGTFSGEGDTASNLIQEEQESKNTVSSYIRDNPYDPKSEQITNLQEKGWSDSKILEYYKNAGTPLTS